MSFRAPLLRVSHGQALEAQIWLGYRGEVGREVRENIPWTELHGFWSKKEKVAVMIIGLGGATV
jgi:hypothetical protein